MQWHTSRFVYSDAQKKILHAFTIIKATPTIVGEAFIFYV